MLLYEEELNSGESSVSKDILIYKDSLLVLVKWIDGLKELFVVGDWLIESIKIDLLFKFSLFREEEKFLLLKNVVKLDINVLEGF